MNDNQELAQIEALIRQGQTTEAYRLVKEFINRDPYQSRAWKLMARVASTLDEKKFAVEQVIRLDPDDEWANKMQAGFEDEKVLEQAISLAREGQVGEGRKLVEEVLEKNPENSDAWYVKARLTKDTAEAEQALNRVLALDPEDSRAQQQLERLRSSAQEEKRRSRLPAAYIWGGLGVFLVLSLLCVLVILPMFTGEPWITFGGAGDDRLEDIAGRPQSCQQLIERAMNVSDATCQKIGSNQVCYGNYDVYAQLAPGLEDQFNMVGDVIQINNLSKLVAAPLNLDENLWGVAVLKVPANLEGTLPGQNVTFMVFGDTSVDNTSGDMSAFYFSSGITGITCNEVAFDGLFIETEEGTGIAFQANGVDFVLEGDAVLQAEPGGEMTVTLIEGSGTVSSHGVTQNVEEGNSVSVPVDEDLEASGPPSDPEAVSEDEVALGCELSGVGCPTQVIGTSAAALYTSAPTNTSVPGTPGMPTNTPVPLFTDSGPSGGPTNTSAPGGGPGATNTNPPPATNTNAAVPATNTPAPVCGSVNMSAGSSPGTFNITNSNSASIGIKKITIKWPLENGALQRVRLATATIASINPNSTDQPTVVNLARDATKNNIATEMKVLSFVFSDESVPVAGSYSVEVEFDFGGCTISASQGQN